MSELHENSSVLRAMCSLFARITTNAPDVGRCLQAAGFDPPDSTGLQQRTAIESAVPLLLQQRRAAGTADVLRTLIGNRAAHASLISPLLFFLELWDALSETEEQLDLVCQRLPPLLEPDGGHELAPDTLITFVLDYIERGSDRPELSSRKICQCLGQCIESPASKLKALIQAKLSPGVRPRDQWVLQVRLKPREHSGWETVCAHLIGLDQDPVQLNLHKTWVLRSEPDLWPVLKKCLSQISNRHRALGIEPSQLILRIEPPVESSLRSFHIARSVRSHRVVFRIFKAVALWPFDYEIGEPIQSRSCCETFTASTLSTATERLADRGEYDYSRPVFLCTAPVWEPDEDGLSDAVESHEGRLLSILLDDDLDTFTARLFRDRPSCPVSAVFDAASEWLEDDRDVRLVWTDSAYAPPYAQPESLT